MPNRMSETSRARTALSFGTGAAASARGAAATGAIASNATQNWKTVDRVIDVPSGRSCVGGFGAYADNRPW